MGEIGQKREVKGRKKEREGESGKDKRVIAGKERITRKG